MLWVRIWTFYWLYSTTSINTNGNIQISRAYINFYILEDSADAERYVDEDKPKDAIFKEGRTYRYEKLVRMNIDEGKRRL